MSLRQKKYSSSFFILLFVLSLIVVWINAREQKEERPYTEIALKLRQKGLGELHAYAILEHLTSVGHRLPGSRQAEAAVERMRQEMEDLGFEEIHLEPTVVPKWVRGNVEEAHINSSSFGTLPLSVCAIGGSIATAEPGISAEVLEVKSFEALKSLGKKARGKIIFFNRPLDPSLIDTFASYGQAADQRVRGAAEAAKKGAVAVLVRSLTTGSDDVPHTGLMVYEPGVKKIPAACVSTKGANLLSELLGKDPSLKVFIRLSCRQLSPVTSFNVVGQITGTEKPKEIILLGAHLDSWDFGTGAHDDGAGCAQVVEALRLLKGLGLRPKRTVRAVLFMNEEFGGGGGKDYVKSKKRKGEKHLAAMESDRGGFLPVGIGIGGSPEVAKRFQEKHYLFEPIGIFWIRRGGGGVDIAPLADSGTITCGLVPDSQRYFDVHHSANDVIETVNPRELELGAIVMALFAFLVAQEGI